MDHIKEIRKNERKSHIAAYSSSALYQSSGWLQKPVKTVLELFPYFDKAERLTVLDLGCGIGRNAIPIAQHFSSISCSVICVDILDLAIEKLKENAAQFHVSSQIHTVLSSIEDFIISRDQYDLVLSVSALEHIDSEEHFAEKLKEIEQCVRPGGMVCYIINTEVTEENALTGLPLPPQFEVNIPTQKLMQLLDTTYQRWEITKNTVRPQEYEIPRGSIISKLHTNVVTFVAKKQATDG